MVYTSKKKIEGKREVIDELIERKSSSCFFMISHNDPPAIQEMNRKAFFESNEDMHLTDLPRAVILCRKNSIVYSYPFQKIDFINVVAKAHEIISTLIGFMEGKVKPKDVVMPIRAAIDAGAIRKPTLNEFTVVFGDWRIKSKSSLTFCISPLIDFIRSFLLIVL